jgi:osmotically-inducible protein OsmY
MTFSKWLTTAALAAVFATGWACTDNAASETRKDLGATLGATKAGADKALEATKKAGDRTTVVAKDLAQKTVDTTGEVAGEVAEKGKEAAVATGAAMTDGWITTKLKAKFADETALEGSDINVDTSDHVVRLRGTVSSLAAKARAALIARGTENVARVVNQLVVKQM